MNEQEDISKVKDFETIRKLALNAPDFVGRLKAVEGNKIDRLTIGGLIDVTNTYSTETAMVIEGHFKEAFRLSEVYKKEKKRIVDFSLNDPVMAPIWDNSEAMYSNFMLGYQKSLQVNALLLQVNVRLTEALLDSYGGAALTQTEAEAISKAVSQLKLAASLLEGLDKLTKAKQKSEV